MNTKKIQSVPVARWWLIPRLGKFCVFWLLALGAMTATGVEPPFDPTTMSDTDLLAAVRQGAEQKIGLTKYARPRMTGKAKEFADHFVADAVQADTRMNDLAAIGMSTAADASSPTIPDKVSTVQGLEGTVLNAKYVQSMLDLSRMLLSLFEQMSERSKNAALKAFGHDSAEIERHQIKDLETIHAGQ